MHVDRSRLVHHWCIISCTTCTTREELSSPLGSGFQGRLTEVLGSVIVSLFGGGSLELVAALICRGSRSSRMTP
jgi:hypothetical protein